MEDWIVAIVDMLLDFLRSLPWSWVLVLFHVFLAPLSAIHAMLYKRDSRSALGWVSVCVFFPLAGPLTYYLFGINRIQTEAQRLLTRRLFHLQVGYERGKIEKPVTKISEAIVETPLTRFSRVSARLTTKPLLAGNRVQLLQNGEECYPAMIAAINAAENFVYLTTYIFETNPTGQEIIDALAQAAARGVDVRVIVDGVGELYSWPRARKLLRAQGVRVAQFLPPKLLPPTLYINLRNHRKILVIDGKHGFTGGMNLGGRHMLGSGDKHRTADIHFSVSGPIVQQLQHSFAYDWKFVTREELPPHVGEIEPSGECYCRCISDGPNEDLDQISMAIITAVATAWNNVVILTPYFLPSREMVAVLQSAALRGVKITIILPEKSNLRFVDWATRNLLWELLQYDITVLYQPAPFAHSKLLLVDGYYAQVGSANQDPRSLRLNFELNMEVIGEELLADLRRYVENICDKSRPLSLEEVDNRPLVIRLRDAFCWLFLPYL